MRTLVRACSNCRKGLPIARGLCPRCYQRARNSGALLTHPSSPSRWTPDHDARVLSAAPAAQLAQELGRSLAAIHCRRATLRGPKRPPARRWGADELNLLKKGRLSNIEVAAAIGRTVAAVATKRSSMGLKLPSPAWQPGEDELLLARPDDDPNYDTQLAQQLGRSLTGVSSRRAKLLKQQGREGARICTHGETRYFKYGCRCSVCVSSVEAKYAMGAVYRERARRRSYDEIPHGTSSGYVYHGCRCEQCRTWNLKSKRRRYTNARENAAAWRQANREIYLARKREQSRAWRARPENRAAQQRHSKAGAAKEARAPRERTGTPWGASDDAVVLRDDITQLQMAHLIHRSVSSIGARRRKLRAGIKGADVDA